MARLLPWFSLALVLLGSAAAAQQPQSPARERQERQVVVPTSPGEPVMEIRVAAGIATTLVFNAAIDRASVEVEGQRTRFRLVDVGERTLFLEPLVPPGDGERLGVRVRYKDGASPASAVFALVSHPTVVDTRVDVARVQRSPEVLEVALAQCEAGEPASLVLSGRLDRNGVRARPIDIDQSPHVQAGMSLKEGTGYRAGTWALAAIRVHNLPGQRPWTIGEARFFRPNGTPVRGVSVRMDRPQLAPGDVGLVVAETEVPYWDAGEILRLELREKGGGRHLVIGAVEL
ncbi:DUF2381 family protein [Archangium sp.]|uniref:DUF2381 family protein n=1 Tax=Archangium sp. TaxID=1872627 RepID=UPI00389A527E